MTVRLSEALARKLGVATGKPQRSAPVRSAARRAFAQAASPREPQVERADAIELWLPGRPVPKQSFRMDRQFAPYQRTRIKAWARAAHTEARLRFGPYPPWSGPLAMTVRFVYRPPRRWPSERRAAAVAGRILPTVRPDWDNLAKNVGDALTAVVWIDDAQVVSARVEKAYGETEGVAVRVAPLDAAGSKDYSDIPSSGELRASGSK